MPSFRKTCRLTLLVAAALAAATGCDGRSVGEPGNVPSGVILQQSGLSALQDQMTKAVNVAPRRAMTNSGLVGVVGGARVQLLTAGTHKLLLPMPQLTEAQIPLCYAITATSREAGPEFHIRQREGSNVVVTVQLTGSREQEIQLLWSSVILVPRAPLSPDHTPPEPYLQPSACAQSESQEVKALAEKLWPANGGITGYAAGIQEFIRGMKQEKQPRSLDALGILQSGGNWICTANANLAVALLRAKGIGARSLAVVPSTGQRLEMHRIVEYAEGQQWRAFDPSSLHRDIPLHPWQNIVMARTTPADENESMKPRMGSAPGCPYGQELELLDSGMTLWGQDFFWTLGKPLAEFTVSDQARQVATTEWRHFLETGKLSPRQVQLASGTNYAAVLEGLKVPAPEPDGAAHRSPPVGAETNRTSSAAGASR